MDASDFGVLRRAYRLLIASSAKGVYTEGFEPSQGDFQSPIPPAQMLFHVRTGRGSAPF
jgi:hypothetical protein